MAISVVTALTAALTAALDHGQYAWLAEIDLPDSTTLRFSAGGYSSLERGHYSAQLKSCQGWSIGASDDGVVAPQTYIDVTDDADGTLETLINGRYRNQLDSGVAFRVYLAPIDGSSDWLLAWSGITVRPEVVEARIIRFNGRVDDRALRAASPRRLIGPAWPLADADARELPGPAIYGVHDGGALGLSVGQIPVYAVEAITSRWLVAGGALKQLLRLYDSTGQINTGNYTASNYSRKGWNWAIITFTVDPTGDVTADAYGVEDTGDGSGTLINNPASQLAHYLSNRVFGQAAGSTWLSTTSKINASSLSSIITWLAGRLYGSDGTSYYAGDVTAGYEVLQEWVSSLEVYTWWRADGTLAFGMFPIDGDPYFSSLVFRWASHDLTGDWLRKADDRDFTHGLRLRHAPSAHGGNFLATLEVLDPEGANTEVRELTLYWSHAG